VQSSNREYLPAVDHLRFAAAGLVLLFHAWHSTSNAPATELFNALPESQNPLLTMVIEGHTGVALFMVLSGFILTTGSLGRDIDYRTFLRNRLLRVGPLYLLVLVVAMVVADQRFSLLGVLQTMLGFATLGGGFTGGAFAQVLWTIGVELQFYLLFPFFLRLLNNHGPRPLVKFIVLMAVLRVIAALATPELNFKQLTYFSIVGRIDQFLIGMLAAYAFPHVRRFLGRAWVAGIAFATVAGGLWVFHQLDGWSEPHLWRTVWVDVEALLWAFLLVSYVGTARFARGRFSGMLSWGGERSYGIYLLHVAVIQALFARGWTLNPPGGHVVDAVVTGLVVVLPCVTLLAALSYSAVEQPFLSLRRRYVGPATVGTGIGLPTSRTEAVTLTTELARMPTQRAGG
jgi:peptidoglycan/LPS O-acetylase OafA/YrhL